MRRESCKAGAERREAHLFESSISQGKVALDVMRIPMNYLLPLLSVATREGGGGEETNFKKKNLDRLKEVASNLKGTLSICCPSCMKLYFPATSYLICSSWAVSHW